MVGHPLAAVGSRRLPGGRALRRAPLDGVGMPKGGLSEQVVLDYVVVEVIQPGSIDRERPEPGSSCAHRCAKSVILRSLGVSAVAARTLTVTRVRA